MAALPKTKAAPTQQTLDRMQKANSKLHCVTSTSPKTTLFSNPFSDSAILDDDEEVEDDVHSLTDTPTDYEEIAGPNSGQDSKKSFIIIRRPSRSFNTSKDNFLAQRSLRKAGVEVKDFALEPAAYSKASHAQRRPTEPRIDEIRYR